MTNTVWDCIYCQRVNPMDKFECVGCGGPRMKEKSKHKDDSIYGGQFWDDGGISTEPTEYKWITQLGNVYFGEKKYDKRLREWLGI